MNRRGGDGGFQRFGSGGSAGLPTATPLDHGMVGWTLDPREVQAGTILPASGTLNVARVKAMSALATNVLLHFTAGGVTLTAGYAGLYTDAGALLSSSADHSAALSNWQGGGLKTVPLLAAQAVTPGNWYKVAWFAAGTTMPTLSRGLNSSTAILNANLSAANSNFATADTGLTTALPNNIGVLTGGATAWWVGLS